MDTGDICEHCQERNCEQCIFGNPCLGCSDYKSIGNSGMGICLSQEGCSKNWKKVENNG